MEFSRRALARSNIVASVQRVTTVTMKNHLFHVGPRKRKANRGAGVVHLFSFFFSPSHLKSLFVNRGTVRYSILRHHRRPRFAIEYSSNAWQIFVDVSRTFFHGMIYFFFSPPPRLRVVLRFCFLFFHLSPILSLGYVFLFIFSERFHQPKDQGSSTKAEFVQRVHRHVFLCIFDVTLLFGPSRCLHRSVFDAVSLLLCRWLNEYVYRCHLVPSDTRPRTHGRYDMEPTLIYTHTHVSVQDTHAIEKWQRDVRVRFALQFICKSAWLRLLLVTKGTRFSPSTYPPDTTYKSIFRSPLRLTRRTFFQVVS